MTEPVAVSAAEVKKPKTEITKVKMTDGREVGFAGKRKVTKETLIDESKIIVDGDTITLQEGAVCVRMDFRNGDTKTFKLPNRLIARFAGHGGEQKYGDELARPSDKPLSEEDMVLEVEELDTRIQAGEWNVPSEGGFGGASIVIKAIMEASSKDLATVKAFLQGKLDKAKAANEKLTRAELYASFRNPASKTGQIIERMEREERSKANKVNADGALDELAAAA